VTNYAFLTNGVTAMMVRWLDILDCSREIFMRLALGYYLRYPVTRLLAARVEIFLNGVACDLPGGLNKKGSVNKEV
jgi:hypothetical protein